MDAFGAPSDVDGDGRIALLFSHLVPDIGRDAFFGAGAVVPSRMGGDGNMTDLLWLSPVAAGYRVLLAHYFQHLINFNQHVLVRRSGSEEIWLNEGLSHVAQDLVAEHENDNYALVRSFLRQPGGAGLSTGIGTLAKRGAAYLFVRSLVDLFGKDSPAAPGADRPGGPRQRRGRHRRELCRPDRPLGGATLRQRHRS